MKQFAYAQKNEEGLKLYLFDSPDPIEPSHAFEALMMSRLDFDLKVTEVPPVHENEMANLLTFKLRSLYPGDPGATVFDYKIIVKNKMRYAVLFITSTATIEEYKNIADKKPLFLPFPIINSLMQRHEDENCIFFYWHREWIDISFYENGIFKSSSAIRREKETFLDFLKIRNILPKNFKEFRIVFIAFADELEQLKEQSLELFKEIRESEFLTVEDTLPILSKKSDSLFIKKKKIPILASLRYDVLAFALVLFVCLIFNKHVDDRSRYLQKLRAHTDRELVRWGQTSQLREKQKELLQLMDKKPADMFFLLSQVGKIFSNEVDVSLVRIETKTETQGKKKIEKISFTIDAKFSRDPLRYLDLFNQNKYFSDVSLPKQDMNKKTFTLTGIFLKGGRNAPAK